MADIEHCRYGTPFMESECLLAVTAGDEEYADAVLGGMTARELRELSRVCGVVAGMARSVERRQRPITRTMER